MRLVCSALLTAILLHASAARASEWRYCLAQDEEARTVYVTQPFLSERPLLRLEAQFNAWLRDHEVNASTGGICPRAISAAGPDADIKAALDYNMGLGLKPKRVNWHPADP